MALLSILWESILECKGPIQQPNSLSTLESLSTQLFQNFHFGKFPSIDKPTVSWSFSYIGGMQHPVLRFWCLEILLLSSLTSTLLFLFSFMLVKLYSATFEQFLSLLSVYILQLFIDFYHVYPCHYLAQYSIPGVKPYRVWGCSLLSL